jgi:hypothetical protein
MEIYNEQIFDLLATSKSASFSEPPNTAVPPSRPASMSSISSGNGGIMAGLEKTRKNLPLRERGSRVVVEGLSTHSVTSVTEAMSLIDSGSRQRQTCNNNLNDSSSRSHSVCTLELVRAAHSSTTAASSLEPVATLWFVDLAGSERNDRTGLAGVSKKQTEANNINTSLFTLMTCLTALRENGQGGARAGALAGRFRESKLTRLLATGFASEAEASRACAALKREGQACMVAGQG